MRHANLKMLLAALLAGVLLVFGTIATVVNTRTAARELEQNAGQAMQNLAYDMTDKLDYGMFERAKDVEILAELESFTTPGENRDEQRALLDKLQRTYPAYAWIGLADPSGTVHVSTGGLLQGASVAQRPWFQGALKGPFAGDVHEAKLLAKLLPTEGNEPLRFVDVAAPIRDRHGRVTGVLGAHLSWTWAKEVRESLLHAVQQRDRLDVLIVDRAGTVLLGPPNLQGTQLPDAIYNRFPVTGHEVMKWPDGHHYVTGVSRSQGYRSYRGLEWRVVVRQHTDVAFASVAAYRRASLAMNSTLAILFALIGVLIAHHIARPLESLRRAAKAIQAGDTATTIDAVRASYAKATDLTRALHELLAAQHRHKQELEHRVEERTIALRVRTNEAEALSALSALSTEERDPLDMVTALAPIIAQASNLDWVGVTRVRGQHAHKTTLFTRAGLNALPDVELAGQAEHGLHHTAVLLGRPLYVDDYATQVHTLPQFVRGGVRSAAFLPLPGQHGERFVLFAARADMRGWTDADRRVMEAAGRSVQIAHERRAHLHDLEFAALHDKLTGLGNRRAFDQNAEQAVSAAKRHDTTFGVMLLDLDGLKRLNDTEGHERGDALLREFGHALRLAFRNEDRIYRLGGDEYAVLLDRAMVPNSDAVLERVRAAVQLARGAGFAGMDASAGVAFYPDDGSLASDLVRLADERMYAEKRNHRSRGEQPGTPRSSPQP